jgi:heat shock protein HslJ
MRPHLARSSLIGAVLVLALVAVATACAPIGADDANRALENTSWTVVSIAGAPTLPEARPTLTFAADGVVSGSTGCNQYSGAYRRDGGFLTFGEIAATLIGCDGDRGLQETAFLAALNGATAWRHGPDGLQISSPAGEIVAGEGIAEGPAGEATGGASGEPSTDLAGTSWTLREMGGTADFAHLIPTLVVGTDGTLSGFAGCNQFNAPYAISGTDFTVGSLTTTKMACTRPGSVVEADYLQGLVGVTSWRIDETGELHLDGASALTFAPG